VVLADLQSIDIAINVASRLVDIGLFGSWDWWILAITFCVSRHQLSKWTTLT